MQKTEKKERTTPMSESAARLYEAVEKLKGITGQSAVARFFNASPQTMSNWEKRGVSADGLADAQLLLGCSALWIGRGIGPMVIGEPFVASEPATAGGLADALKLTCETAAELQLLSVYRLSNQDHRKGIELAIEVARKALDWAAFFNDRK